MFLEEQPLSNGAPLDRIHRPRLASLLERASAATITVLVGPAGSGKTDVVRAHIQETDAIYFRVGNGNRTFASFVRGLARALAPVAPGAQASFARAWERSLQSRSPPVALAYWLCEHIDDAGRTIVIDDLHDAAADLSIASFTATLAELRPDAKLTVAARSVGALPIALWMATRQMQRPIDEADLRFDRAEIVEEAHRVGVELEDGTIRAVILATTGLPIAVAYALARLRADPRQNIPATIPSSFEGIAADIFARRTQYEKSFLLSAAMLPNVEDRVLRLLGCDDPEAARSAMGSDTAFMWESDAQSSIRFHDRFCDYLVHELQSRDRAFTSTIAQRVVDSLIAAGRHAAALEVATRQRMMQVLGELLDSHGFVILESGEIDIISKALGAVEESSLGAVGLALRGYIEARSGHLDTAEAWFRLGLDRAPDEASRVVIALYYARELTKRRRADACDVLEAFVTSTTLPRHLLISVRSAFARALTTTNRLDEARFHANEALALLDADSPPALRARVVERASFVALVSGQPEIARERALIAAPLAAAQSLYEVAATAYGMLYNIAYDIDDDSVLAREYLHCYRDLGSKSGMLRIDLFWMLSMYELDAEAGDEAALSDMNKALAKVDKHDASSPIMEVMIPSQALQAGWIGKFDEAQRLLKPAAARQATPARRALCWAQVALYCAAAANAQGATEALRAAEETLGTLEDHEFRTTQYGLTLLDLALASLVTNDIERARRWTNLANDAAIGHARRLCALRAAIQALIAGFGDAERLAQDLPRTLAALRAESFGGMAKLIEALPYPFASSGGAKATIGSLLRGGEPSARVLPSPVSEDALPARREFAPCLRPAPAVVGLIDDIDASIEALFEQLEAASPLMAEHTCAVSAWCSRLARTLGLSESEIAFVTRCGLIHDIGKIRTPAEILNAPRRLTPDEWVIMRAHTTEGSLIVGRVPILRPFVPIVRGHHERLDGKGYPDGLSAKAIPLAARVVTVADCFNAMIGRRPHRSAMAPTEALNELERHSGTQFDPEIVEAMTQIVLGRVVEPV